MFKRLVTIMLTFILVLAFVSSANAAAKTWNDVVNDIDKELSKAIVSYKDGDAAAAKGWVNEAYFGPYEGAQMEKMVRLNISAQSNAKIEGQFRDIKKAINGKEDFSEVENKIEELSKDLKKLANQLDGKNNSSFGVFISAFLIIVREGFEAILVLGAIIAYLVKSDNQERIKTIYQGVLVAILASLATAVAIKYIFNITGTSQELLEGVTMLIAVAVLFSMSFWLVGKVQAQKWKEYIEGKVKESLGKGSTLALWFAVFLAVYREGAETVLFYLAMFSGAEEGQSSMIALGIIIGFIALVGIFLIVRFGSVKIPIKPFFICTSLLMYYLAFVFAGRGINELQAGGHLGITTINIPTVGFLGIYPTLETVSIQALLIAAALGGLIYQFSIRAKSNYSG